MTAYQQIKKEAALIGWPLHYKTDLTEHDRKTLQGYKGQFLWLLREHGTQLVLLKKGKTRQEFECGLSQIKYFSEEEGYKYHLYHFDGKELQKIPAADAKRLILNEIETAIDMKELTIKTFETLTEKVGRSNIIHIMDYYYKGVNSQIAEKLLKLPKSKLLKFNKELKAAWNINDQITVAKQYI